MLVVLYCKDDPERRKSNDRGPEAEILGPYLWEGFYLKGGLEGRAEDEARDHYLPPSQLRVNSKFVLPRCTSLM